MSKNECNARVETHDWQSIVHRHNDGIERLPEQYWEQESQVSRTSEQEIAKVSLMYLDMQTSFRF